MRIKRIAVALAVVATALGASSFTTANAAVPQPDLQQVGSTGLLLVFGAYKSLGRTVSQRAQETEEKVEETP